LSRQKIFFLFGSIMVRKSSSYLQGEISAVVGAKQGDEKQLTANCARKAATSGGMLT
jgi:hypothetical protein